MILLKKTIRRGNKTKREIRVSPRIKEVRGLGRLQEARVSKDVEDDFLELIN